METTALILESDQNAAQTLLAQIESLSPLKCVVATNAQEAKFLLHTQPTLGYIFCVYDVSSNEEQLREQELSGYVRKNYPEVTVYSMGSLKKEEVTLSEHKILLFDRDHMAEFLKFTERIKGRSRKVKNQYYKPKSDVYKKKVIQCYPQDLFFF